MGRLGEIDAALERTDLSPRAQLTLLHLLNLPTNVDGHRFPSVGYLARRMGCSTDVARRALHELEDKGAAEVVPRYSVDGRQTSNGYVLVLTGGGGSARGEGGVSATPEGGESARDGGGESARPGVSREESAGRSDPPNPPQAGDVDNPSRCTRHRRRRRNCADCQLPPLAPVPGWCGTCESPDYRWLVDADGHPITKCPDCHESTVRSA